MQFRKKSTKDLVHPDSGGGAKPPENDGTIKGKKQKPPKADRPKLPIKDFLKSKTFAGIVCVAAALLLSFVFVPLMQMKLASTVPVVVLSDPVPAGTLITADMLTTREMGEFNLPMGTILQASDAIGKYLNTAGLQGDILTTSRLSDTQLTDDPALTGLPEGMLAMSVPLSNLEQSVSAKLRASDIIQLFAVLNSAEATVQAPPELQRVEVLAVTNHNARDIEVGQSDEVADSDRIVSTVTLAVNARQALTLAGLNHDATLYAALVTRGNPTAKAAALAQQDAFFVDDTPSMEEAPDPSPSASVPPPPTVPADLGTAGEGGTA